ncbi:putative metalloreductase AIM14-like protein [Cladobotryum mycophilum]|uniref:Metalloreductase AIM14-like protein n=1 Tax=Cladobotryum mycophilum TaxID=491253 RepID=A0ABR0SU18_9HYPO
MGWPYEFLKQSNEELAHRRSIIDLYGQIAHISSIAPLLIAALVRLAIYAARFISKGGSSSSSGSRVQYQEVPGSPAVKARRASAAGGLAASWRKLVWWLGDDVTAFGSSWGQRDEWILGLAWTTWLMALSVRGTGRDYMHVTKRFGIVGISQLPVQYLLSLKSLNPYAWAFNSSHEHLNRYHRVLGRIVYGLLLFHIVLYNNFFLQNSIWMSRFFKPVIFMGHLLAFSFHSLAGTAMASLRRYSYRLFFITHLTVALYVPALVFFHATSARIYVVEAAVVFIFDLAARKMGTVTTPSTVETISGTDLVKVSVPLPAEKAEKFRSLPGSHIYLNIPPTGRTAKHPSSKSLVFDFLYNPFTVASVKEDNSGIAFVARRRNGPMTNVLNDFASPSSSGETKVSLAIEGPYGEMGKHFQNLLTWSPTRILLVAGGVGATFTVPLYHAIQTDLPAAKIQFVWAIRTPGDATWAISTGDDKKLLEDENVQLYLTGDLGLANDADNAAGAGTTTVELDAMFRDSRRGRFTSEHNRKRPDIQKIVDDAFRQGLQDKVAVLVCGPTEMTWEVRRHVRPWVMKGRDVWWHNESFGW